MPRSHREVMATHILEYKGRVVEAVGDKILAEFANAVEAVQAALAIQKELKVRNAQVAENRRMEFRIGINLGDVTDEGDTISGEGVQVVAKVESVSEAGGIGLSGPAYEQVKSKLALRCQYLGTQSVKNIEKLVRIYRVLIEAKGFSTRISIWKGAAVRQWERLNPG
jgi:adenylate cyclase